MTTATKKGSKKKEQASAPAPVKFTQQDVEVLMLDPSVIMFGDNVQFGLKKARIAELKAQVIADGGIRQPVEVIPLTGEEQTANPGKEFKTHTGNYRTAVAHELQAEGHEVKVPCVLRDVTDAAIGLRERVAENVQREDMSPMDCAVAIDKMLKAGISRADIRKSFPRRARGNKIEPASNSWINICHSFLEFPRRIQNLIHEGHIGFTGAFTMHGKAAKDASKEEKTEIWTKIADALDAQDAKEFDKADKLEEEVS